MHPLFEHRKLPFDSFVSENLTYYPHLHPMVELVYVQQGELEMTIDGSQILLQQGDLAVAFPNTVHSYQANRHNETHLLIFSTALISDFSQIVLQKTPVIPCLCAGQVDEEILGILHRLQTSETVRSTQGLLRGYLLVLMGRLLGQLMLKPVRNAESGDLLHRLLVFIDVHYKEPLCLGRVAGELGVSKYHLSRCFTQRIGCNFNVYINALRVQYAQRLLVESSLPITEIGYESGFESIGTFYRAFKDDCGEAPGVYRLRYR